MASQGLTTGQADISGRNDASGVGQRLDELEARLVKLRHRAFAELDTTRARPDWPPEVPDLFADISGLPEIGPDELSARTLASGIQHHGSLVVRGLTTPARAEALAEGIDRTMAGFDQWMESGRKTPNGPWFKPFKPDPGQPAVMVRPWVHAGGGALTADAPWVLFELFEVFRETGLDRVIEEHLGERPAVSAKKSTLRRVPPDLGSSGWHQDGSFLERGTGLRTVNVWLCLSHCGEDAPGMDILPRRLDGLLPTGTEGAMLDWSVSPTEVEKAAVESPVVRPVFAPGDAVFFDQFNLHRTALAPGMTRPRHAIETWFFAPSSYPDHHIPIVI